MATPQIMYEICAEKSLSKKWSDFSDHLRSEDLYKDSESFPHRLRISSVVGYVCTR